MTRPTEPSWNANPEDWVAYAAELGIEIPDRVPDERDRIRNYVVAAVAADINEFDDDDYDDDGDEPVADS